mmetsp:Transcript_25300/g.52940  ORF Transcript_25300/g.52940 Transcript_25300/m.52940 type:complete len:557 (+) Transcript_25300:198-1868(+)
MTYTNTGVNNNNTNLQRRKKQARQQSPPPEMVASMSSTDFDDIEGGSYSSCSDEDSPKQAGIVPRSKSISHGGFVRRDSQEISLTHRRSGSAHRRRTTSVDQEVCRPQSQDRSVSSGSVNSFGGGSLHQRNSFPRAPASIPVNFGGYHNQNGGGSGSNNLRSSLGGGSTSAAPSSNNLFRNSFNGLSNGGGVISNGRNDCLPLLNNFGSGRSYRFSRYCASTPKSVKLFFLSVFLMISFIIYQQHQMSVLRNDLNIVSHNKHHLFQIHKQTIQDLATANEDVASMKKTLEKMSQASASMHQYTKQIEEDKKELLKGGSGEGLIKGLEKKLEVAERRLESLRMGIQENSRKAVIEKYGKGPHKVTMQVQMPSNAPTPLHIPKPTTDDSIYQIQIELAPLDLMPHSVHTFLQQVDSKAWDNTHFDLHAGHVLLARRDADADIENNSPFKNTKYAVPSVSFPEFSPLFPHDKYTVAFPGRRETGQDFYINLISNTNNHSPRTDKEGKFVEGEPCFGKIVDENSRKIVDWMDSIKTIHGGIKDGILEEPVTIVSAKIVGV